jgi:hypothetical protein
MKRLFSFSLAVFCLFCLLVASERRAYAYVDPGTGFMALQSLAAGLAAAGYFLRRRISALFGKKPAAGTSAAKGRKPVVKTPVVAVAQVKDTRSAA